MGPLEGIRILDLTSMVSGPLATMILADQGADVIKVEPPRGEQMRFMGTAHNGVPAIFYSCNRGKRSLPLDLKTEAGRDVLRGLVRQADVLVQNFRPGAIERLGFGEQAVRAENPSIVYTSISGFGEHGPYAHKRVYDPVIQALSGATDIQANRETGRPGMFRIIVADKVTSLTAAQAITAALLHRERTGEGQHLRLSMLEALLAFFWPEGMGGLVYGEKEFDVRREQGTQDLIYETRDGYITAGAVSDAEWAGMCRALGREDLLEDERFATSLGRVRNAEARKRLTAEAIREWDAETLLARFEAEEVPSAPLLSRMDLMEHPQITENGSVDRSAWPGFGEVRQARPAARFDRTPAVIRAPAPQLGQHSREILAMLGYDDDRIAELLAAGAGVAQD
ncbi:MAG: CoA transferase [Pseudomonadales bacterium]|jgi:crotonobetainyl-CoA:carnitine CoA-transferase CaiB-like acyl-CoA transferase|nr:CoA transferase [Pseudomonadales bacterium]